MPQMKVLGDTAEPHINRVKQEHSPRRAKKIFRRTQKEQQGQG